MTEPAASAGFLSTGLKPRRLLVILSAPAGALLVLGWFLRQPILRPPPAAAGAEAADPARLEAHVRMLSETLSPRDAAHPPRLDRVAAFIHKEFQTSGAAVSDFEYTFQERNQKNKLEDQGPFRNVMARFGPEGGERIVVGAHYDAAGEKPGADDNASGVAGLLELARLLGRQAPPLRVDLVAYSTEEPPYYGTGFMGSAFHARALRQEGAAVRAMLSLEMLGAFSDAPGSQRYPAPLARLYYPGRGDFIAVAGRFRDAALARRVKRAMWAASPLPVYSLNSPPGIPGIPLSDHASYWDAGFPALMITDTAFYRNERYHTPEDTADRLDYARMAMVVTGVHAAVQDLAR